MQQHPIQLPEAMSSSSSSQSQRPQHRRVLSQSERLLRATLAKQDARSAAVGANGGVSDVDEDECEEDADREMWARNMPKSPHCSPAQFLSVQQWQLQASSAMSSPSPSPRTRTSPLPPPPSPALARTFSGAALAPSQSFLPTTPARPGHRQHQSISALPSSTSLLSPNQPAVSLRRNNSIASNASAASPIPRSSHEAILRARLESVLAAAESHTDGRKLKQPNRSHADPADNHHKLSPNEWPWTAEAPVTPTSDSTPPLSSDSHPSSSDSHPPSPTATPPRVHSGLKLPNAFDVRTASIECKAKSGYVSFGDIEGLGSPPEDSDADSDDEDDPQRRTAIGRFLLGGWWKAKTKSSRPIST